MHSGFPPPHTAVKCTPFPSPRHLHTSLYRHKGTSLYLTTSLHLISFCLTLSVTSIAHFSAQWDPRLGKSCPWCRSTSARGQTEKGSSRFCSATDLAHHLRQISQPLVCTWSAGINKAQPIFVNVLADEGIVCMISFYTDDGGHLSSIAGGSGSYLLIRSTAWDVWNGLKIFLSLTIMVMASRSP